MPARSCRRPMANSSRLLRAIHCSIFGVEYNDTGEAAWMTADSARATPLHLRQRLLQVSAPCSAGKKRAACRFIANRIAAAGCTESFYLRCTIEAALEQVRAELDALGADVVTITSDTN